MTQPLLLVYLVELTAEANRRVEDRRRAERHGHGLVHPRIGEGLRAWIGQLRRARPSERASSSRRKGFGSRGKSGDRPEASA